MSSDVQMSSQTVRVIANDGKQFDFPHKCYGNPAEALFVAIVEMNKLGYVALKLDDDEHPVGVCFRKEAGEDDSPKT